MRARLPCRASRFSCARCRRWRSFCVLRNDGRLLPAKVDSLPRFPDGLDRPPAGFPFNNVRLRRYMRRAIEGHAPRSPGKLEAAPGFEPGNKGFADPRLTTWLCRLEEVGGRGVIAQARSRFQPRRDPRPPRRMLAFRRADLDAPDGAWSLPPARAGPALARSRPSRVGRQPAPESILRSARCR